MATSATIGQIVERIVASGKITRADENYLLHANLYERSLSYEELHQVRQLFDRVQMGLLQVER